MENSSYTERDQIMIAEGALSVVVRLKLIIEMTAKSKQLAMIDDFVDRFLSSIPEKEVNDMRQAITSQICKQMGIE